jgi:hypothetical protein
LALAHFVIAENAKHLSGSICLTSDEKDWIPAFAGMTRAWCCRGIKTQRIAMTTMQAALSGSATILSLVVSQNLCWDIAPPCHPGKREAFIRDPVGSVIFFFLG